MAWFPPSWEKAGTHWGNTEVLWPTELFAADDARVSALLAEVRERHGGGFCEGTIRWTGLKEPVIHPYLSAYTTMASLVRGEHEKFVEEFYWYLLHSTATHAFPEGIFLGRRSPGATQSPTRRARRTSPSCCATPWCMSREMNCTCFWACPIGGWKTGREIRIEKAPTHFGTMSLRLRGTAKGVEVKLDPPRRQPPTRIVLHLPNSRPVVKAPKGVSVVYRPDDARRWDFPTIIEAYRELRSQPPTPNH